VVGTVGTVVAGAVVAVGAVVVLPAGAVVGVAPDTVVDVDGAPPPAP
jgi:hypothetical protein